MIFIVGHSVYSYDENVEGLWVHYCIREADLDVDIGGRGAPVPGRPDM